MHHTPVRQTYTTHNEYCTWYSSRRVHVADCDPGRSGMSRIVYVDSTYSVLPGRGVFPEPPRTQAIQESLSNHLYRSSHVAIHFCSIVLDHSSFIIIDHSSFTVPRFLTRRIPSHHSIAIAIRITTLHRQDISLSIY